MDRVEIAGLVMSAILIVVVYLFIMKNGFPAFLYAVSNTNLVDVTRQVGRESSLFMWSRRGIDLIVQALVLLGAAVGSLALLRREE
ncbi:hypothetical protein DRO58_08235 [Candidatus Bathyarchaeota archaeon]|nr:MAG: hypothetical protein DRO58_08235 [Candidatus Bathyarchaeota archaeon]